VSVGHTAVGINRALVCLAIVGLAELHANIKSARSEASKFVCHLSTTLAARLEWSHAVHPVSLLYSTEGIASGLSSSMPGTWFPQCR
jgi:hypothetical protein